MLNNYDAKQFKQIYIALGYTDLRKGIDGLATLIKSKYNLDPCANAYICLIWRVIKLHMLIRLSVTIYLIPIFFRQNDEV